MAEYVCGSIAVAIGPQGIQYLDYVIHELSTWFRIYCPIGKDPC